MIPSVIATQVKQGIEDFLRTTYPPEDPFFENILENFFKEQNSLFRGPFLSLKLPFRPGTGKTVSMYPELPMKFPPYLHQEIAFERLSAESPKSTLIATGTGSGKTECFMYPILDYCYQHRGEPGIKAIIIYPMNALATDQAKRFSREIYYNSALHGNVSAGLFIGGEADSDGIDKMSEDSVITCKNAMRKNPPDILMTNYKMLDFLLLRPKDYPIWQYNSPETLRYIAVDELHTFDGAQGTDLACLLRRLLHRIKTTADKICFIGTSATLGGGDGGKVKMSSFAEKLFGTAFDADSIITEDVLKPEEFLDSDGVYYPTPGENQLQQLNADNYTSERDYLKAQCPLWFGEDFELPEGEWDDDIRIELGDRLRQHLFFQRLIELLDNKVVEEFDLSSLLNQIIRGFSKKSNDFQEAFIDSIFALVSFARRRIEKSDGSKQTVPFLQVRAQLWLRELRRMVATVEHNPRLRYAADLHQNEPIHSLPLLHCRDCGHIGYLSVMSQGDNVLASDSDLQKIYSAFFSNSPKIQFIYADDGTCEQPGFSRYLCGHCLTLNDGDIKKCPSCGKDDALIKVIIQNPRQTNSNGHIHVYRNCPFCGGTESLTVLGSRSASLTSVVISQLFASQFNDDQKLLAFSDSVQDASHRAGFFSARTYGFNLRAAIQQVLDNNTDQLTLETIVPVFVKCWGKILGSNSSFVAQFIPPDLQYRKDYEDMVKSGKLPEHSSLGSLIQKRIQWEILSEYGYRSRIGRTLEKSSCSIAHLKGDLLNQWVDLTLQQLKESIGPLRDLSSQQVKRFLVGMVRMIRIRGGIYSDFLAEYMKNGNSFALKKTNPFLPDFGKGRAPVFPFLGTGAPPRFDALTGSGKTKTNYQRLLCRCWGDVFYYSNEIFSAVMDIGEKLDIIHVCRCGNYKTYALKPSVLEIEKTVEQFQCNQSKHMVSTPLSEHELWEGMPSPRWDIEEAQLVLSKNTRHNFYGELYKYGKVHRVIAREHTGLLEREARENLEKSFIDGNGIAAPNILSCTPTLEMGINIGNLSSVILCSVPPSQANYVQRIGRAGRRDGNAFNFVVAIGRPHDLHFFSEPMEMISGDVIPPGVFLNAPAVLERQLTAFCFDRWVESNQGNPHIIPDKLNVVVEAVAKRNQDKFPYTFLRFIDLQREDLLHHFFEIFPNVLSEETKGHLQTFMRDHEHNGLDNRILNRLEVLQKEKKSLKDKLNTVHRKLQEIARRPLDENTQKEIDDLTIEKHAIQDALMLYNNKLTFNFLTDEGLLPNYAFPEAGVTLRSIIYRKKEKAGNNESLYETSSSEYERSGRSAIQEFAPGNTFYVDGRKLLINRINMADSSIERWHFCGCCNHIEKLTDDQHLTTCPKCGSSSWADGNLTRNVLRLKQVISNQSDKESRSFDESDEREPVFYNKFMLAELSSDYVEKAYQSNDEHFPFGIDFLRKATFREVNFGEQDFFEGNTIEIAAKKVSRNGFMVCKECGAVAEREKTGEPPRPFKHTVTCRHYGKPDSKGIIECLYLYREFESEALRLLLPLEDIDFDLKLNSFIAALYMGLKERFEGNVDHLQVMIHEEPLPEVNMKKRYLVLYDQVPGGTGYLKQLANTPDDFILMLENALKKLNFCQCNIDPNKDGCYSCLYAYRVSHDLPNISRNEAREVISSLVSLKGKLQETKSIDGININALFDSDLERRFIEGLRRSSYNNQSVEVKNEIFNGKTGYLIKVGNYSYRVELQVDIDENDGVSVPCRADFVITPERQSTVNIHPIVVFTDGFQFHANLNTDNYRFDKDLEQRMALVKSEHYYCWSLSYDDVMTRFNKPHSNESLADSIPSRITVAQPLRGIDKQNPFDALIAFLAHPEKKDWEDFAFAYGISFSHSGHISESSVDAIYRAFTENKVFDYSELPQSETNGRSGFWAKRIDANTARCSIVSIWDSRQNNPKHVQCLIRISDEDNTASSSDFQKIWNDILQAYNLLQFLPDTVITTDQFVSNHRMVLTAPQLDSSEEWQEIISVTDPKYYAIIKHLKQQDWGLPEPGYELGGSMGEVLSTCIFAWEEAKIAIVDSPEEKTIFEEHEWTAIVYSDPFDYTYLNSLFQRKGL